MLASYIISRTLVPILMDMLLSQEAHSAAKGVESTPRGGPIGVLWSAQRGFERRFERFRAQYGLLLSAVLRHKLRTFGFVGVIFALTALLFVSLGQDYYPQIDAGQMTLHARARSGLRIEETERFFQEVEDVIREVIPEKERELILDNIGLPQITYNFAFSDGSIVGYNDGQIMISLKEGHAPTRDYMKRLRQTLAARFPAGVFYFQPADMITQILNFGVPAPVALRISGRDVAHNQGVARRLLADVKGVKGLVDAHIHQILDAPDFYVDVDRVRAQELGITQSQIANNVNVSLSSSFQVAPNFWADPQSGIPYQVSVQTPEYRLSSVSALDNTPILGVNGGSGGRVDLLSNVVKLERGIEPAVATHFNTLQTYDIYANLQDRDLGSVEADLRKIIAKYEGEMRPGNTLSLRGQIESKNQAFQHFGLGLLASMVFVYLLMVVNFQSWGDPFVVILALPLAFCGIVASLFVTGTSISIPSLMGAIMSVGVASANSILLVTFARELREETGCTAQEAAITAGMTRVRPVLMTAAAMLVGLLPMSLGLGDGAEQNAALARAVMGGILFGTCSTLLFAPFLYSILRTGAIKTLEDYL